jgi:hypothetical protein
MNALRIKNALWLTLPIAAFLMIPYTAGHPT